MGKRAATVRISRRRCWCPRRSGCAQTHALWVSAPLCAAGCSRCRPPLQGWAETASSSPVTAPARQHRMNLTTKHMSINLLENGMILAASRAPWSQQGAAGACKVHQKKHLAEHQEHYMSRDQVLHWNGCKHAGCQNAGFAHMPNPCVNQSLSKE